jgi:purine-binding chemotaxis protein CheW
VTTQHQAPHAPLDVLVCRVGAERYAVSLATLRSIHRAAGTDAIVPVPCTPAFVAGLLNVRGEVVTVLHLSAALGLPVTPAVGPERGQVLLVDAPPSAGSAQAQLGLLVDDVLAVESIDLAALAAPLADDEWTRGIAPLPTGPVSLIDVGALLASGRFDVAEVAH